MGHRRAQALLWAIVGGVIAFVVGLTIIVAHAT
jgi:hypothetical protein